MMDVNKHIIRAEWFSPSEDKRGTFYMVAEGSVFKYEFAGKVAPVAGLRNRLFHRYERISVGYLLPHVKKNHLDFK